MSRSALRSSIIVLTLITAIVHLVVLNLGGIDPLFTLNGIAYLVLLWAFINPPGFLQDQETLLHIAFIGFAIITIIAFILFNGPEQPTANLGYFTKVDEILLVVALALHMNSTE